MIYSRLFFVISLAIALAGCQTTPATEFRLKEPQASPDAEQTTFTTEIKPAFAYMGLLRWLEQEVTQQMQALGYSQVEADGDLTIRAYLEPTDQMASVLEPADSVRIHLQMRSEDQRLREGATPNLTSTRLATFSRSTMAGIVENFLEGFPPR
jgi:hypothetical protein